LVHHQKIQFLSTKFLSHRKMVPLGMIYRNLVYAVARGRASYDAAIGKSRRVLRFGFGERYKPSGRANTAALRRQRSGRMERPHRWVRRPRLNSARHDRRRCGAAGRRIYSRCACPEAVRAPGFVRAHVCPLPLPAISHASNNTKPGVTVSRRPVRLRISSASADALKSPQIIGGKDSLAASPTKATRWPTDACRTALA
jgi:hypothetical protein